MEVNVIPLDDLIEHEESLQCCCNPEVRIVEDGLLIIHASLDRREVFEAKGFTNEDGKGWVVFKNGKGEFMYWWFLAIFIYLLIGLKMFIDENKRNVFCRFYWYDIRDWYFISLIVLIILPMRIFYFVEKNIRKMRK